jgi:hypothetical protein
LEHVGTAERTRRARGVPIQGASLVRVLAVPEVAGFLEGDPDEPREPVRGLPSREPRRISSRISGYLEGSTTTPTDAKFFAAARTIAGPPMSIFSITSSVPAPAATVSRNG